MCVRANEKGRERGKSLGDKLTLCNSGEEGKKGRGEEGICIFFCSLLILCVVHAETLTKGSLLPNQERRFLWCYCVQLRNRNAISHVLKLFGLFLVRRADVFSHLFRASIPSFSESSVLRDSHSRAG